MSGPGGVSDDRLRRLSLNQWTVRRWNLKEAVDGCARHGIGAIGVWREHVASFGTSRSAALLRESGLRVSSLCRGGFFGRPDWLDDNRAAIDEAAAIGAACLVLVAGGLPDSSRDLAGARSRAGDAIGALVPYAAERGVRLAIEPMHPMYCANRGVVSTLRQALDIAGPYPPGAVGVMIDTFHLWWDPEVAGQIAAAGQAGRITGFQVSDFLSPLPADVLLGRAMMGDGVIDFAPLCHAVAAAGYAGDVEVEIFNADVWAADPDSVLSLMKQRFRNFIGDEIKELPAPGLTSGDPADLKLSRRLDDLEATCPSQLQPRTTSPSESPSSALGTSRAFMPGNSRTSPPKITSRQSWPAVTPTRAGCRSSATSSRSRPATVTSATCSAWSTPISCTCARRRAATASWRSAACAAGQASWRRNRR